MFHKNSSPLSKGNVTGTVAAEIHLRRCCAKSLREWFLPTELLKRLCLFKMSTTSAAWPMLRPRAFTASVQAARNLLRSWPLFSDSDICKKLLEPKNDEEEFDIFDSASFKLMSFQTFSFQTVSFQTFVFSNFCLFRLLSFQTLSFQTLSFQTFVFSDSVFSDVVFSDRVFSDFVLLDRVFSDCVFSDVFFGQKCLFRGCLVRLCFATVGLAKKLFFLARVRFRRTLQKILTKSR